MILCYFFRDGFKNLNNSIFAMASNNLNNTPNGRIQYISNHTGNRFIRPAGPMVRAAGSPQTVSSNELAQKCQNFLDTLVRLADDKGQEVGVRVRNLVTQLINSELQPEKFGELISSTVIGSRPQPGLVPFLQKSLPFLRRARMNGANRSIPTASTPSSNKSELLSILPSGYSGRLPGETVRAVHVSQLPSSTPASNSNFILAQPIKTSNVSSPQVISSVHPNSQHNVQSRQVIHEPTPGQTYIRAPTPNNQSASPVILQAHGNGDLRRHVQQKIISVPRNNSSPRPPIVNNTPNSQLREDDGGVEDINDVTSQTGINLNEEANFLTEDNLVPVNQLPRAPSRSLFVSSSALNTKISNMASKYQFEEPVSPKVSELVAVACQRYLKTLIEKLGAAAQHRSEVLRRESRYEISSEVKPQTKFFQKIEIADLQKRKEIERENLVKAAKSRSKNEDPDEQQKAKRKVREMEMANSERLTASQTNAAAIHALDDSGMPPRKRMMLESGDQKDSLSVGSLSRDPVGLSSRGANSSWRPKRVVNLKDAVMVFEQEKSISSSLIYEALLKL